MITPQGMKEQTIKFYNPTLDEFKVQCDSKVFRFYPRQTTDVPFSLTYVLEEQLKERGVFVLYPTYSKEDIRKKELESLKYYKDHGALRMRIANFFAYVDEMKKRGVTLEESPEMKRALRIKRELEVYLKENKEIEKELSFFDDSKRKELGWNDDGVTHISTGLPSIEDITLDGAQVVETPTPKKLGRPKKVSFEQSDTDILAAE